MVEIWYQYPEILLNNLNEFIPNNSLSKSNNINAIARFAIYFSLLILIFKQDIKWLLISLLLLFISYYLNISNYFFNKSTVNNSLLTRTTNENPFMNNIINNTLKNSNTFSQLLPNNISINSDPKTSLNFSKNNLEKTPIYTQSQPKFDYVLPQTENMSENMSGNNNINDDLCLTSNNNKSCLSTNEIIKDNNLPNKYKINDELKKEIRKNYRSHLKFDSIDIWGKLINDRNYYTAPNIDIVNDQEGFAKWCYTNDGKSGNCKTYGKDCVKDSYILGRNKI